MADSAGESSRDADKAPTIAQVAALAGVSTATVSRVASGQGGVRDVTRLRVEQAIAGLIHSGPARRISECRPS